MPKNNLEINIRRMKTKHDNNVITISNYTSTRYFIKDIFKHIIWSFHKVQVYLIKLCGAGSKCVDNYVIEQIKQFLFRRHIDNVLTNKLKNRDINPAKKKRFTVSVT